MWWCAKFASTLRCCYLQTAKFRRSLPGSIFHSRAYSWRMMRQTVRSHGTTDPLLGSRTCWKCAAAVETTSVQFFCPACNVIQPPAEESTHFEIMDSPTTFQVNTSNLTKTYKALQWKLHPDKFSINQKEEQGFSDQQASLVNKAYHTLLKPLSRGLYLLELSGFPIEEGTTDANPEFLMEIMEVNERLAEELTEAELKVIECGNKVLLDKCIEETSEAFERGDFEEARNVLSRMKYYSNIDDQIKEKQVALLWQ